VKCMYIVISEIFVFFHSEEAHHIYQDKLHEVVRLRWQVGQI